MGLRRWSLAALLAALVTSAACEAPTGQTSGGDSNSSGTATGASTGSSGGSSGSGANSGSGGSSSSGSSHRATSTGTTGAGSNGSSSSTGGSSSGSSGGAPDAGFWDGGFDPGQPGPYPVGSTLNLTQTLAGQSVPFDLYYPTAADGGALLPADGGIAEVLVSHGWLDSKASFSGWGTHLASWGFAVAVPTWTNGMDDTEAQVNAASANALLAWMDSEGEGDPASPLFGLVDGKRHGLVGHSFGGLMVYVAASENSTVQVVAGLDPVDDGSTAADAVVTFAGMGVMLPAQPALCDLGGNDQATVYANFPGQKLYAQVANAIHCDCQDPAGSCQDTCGPVDPIRQMHFQRYATAALLWALECDPRTLPWIDGAAIAADTGLSSYQSAMIACVPPP